MQTLFPPDQPTGSNANSTSNSIDLLENPWEIIKNCLMQRISEESYKTWIEPLKGQRVGDDEVLVALPNLVFYQGLHTEFLPQIEQIKSELELDHIVLRFEVSENEASESSSFTDFEDNQSQPGLGSSQFDGPQGIQVDVPVPEHRALQNPTANVPQKNPIFDAPVSTNQGEPKNAFSRSLSPEGNLIRNYTFENFVKGDSNQFAVATCLSASENPGKAYNPLFLYGSTGLGKTHLLHAVGNRVLEFNPNAIVTYISSERFMNEMIYCIRFNKMWDFRQKYRNCDVFLVDDILFISGKKSTQEEFFHTFNTLYAAKKQIVITSDLFPKDIPDIEDRLRNRFQWGLIADIQPPSIEHRIAILMTKAEKLRIALTEEVAEYIAKHAKRNVRILEGALHRINAFARLQGEPITLDLAVRTFKDVLGEAPKRLTIETIQKATAEHFKLRVADLKSKRRQRAFALPRQIAMYLCRKLTNASFPEIGDKFGGKDHTTVMHNVKKIDLNLNKDLDLKAHVETLERHLEQLQ
jgi:chromosomal replication initiator protein